MKIKELPEMERPYEKLEANGAVSLSNAELLSIFIKTGTKNKTALAIAQDLLKGDTEDKGIAFLNDLSIEELMLYEGIGRVKAIEIKAICEFANRWCRPDKIIRRMISTPEDVYKILWPSFRGSRNESIKTILLDGRNKIIKIVNNAVGTGNYSYVAIKDIFMEPVRCGATRIVVSHNHPSGDSSPSAEDISFTKKICEAGKIFGIDVMDHVIIGNHEFTSMKRLKKM